MKSLAETQSALVWTITELHSQSAQCVNEVTDIGLPILSAQ